MNVLPTTTNTIGNWPLQDSLVDTSGHGLTLAVEYGSEVYEAIGTLRGFRLDQGAPIFSAQNSLLAPDTSLLRIGGNYTISCLWLPRKTVGGQFLFDCRTGASADLRSDPALYSGGCMDAAAAFCRYDQVIDGFSGPALALQPSTTIHAYVLAGLPIFVTYRRSQSSASTNLVELFINGVLIASGSSTAGVMTAAGTERFVIGGLHVSIFAGATCCGVLASFRLENYAQPTSTIVDDYRYVVLGIPYPAAETTLVYDAIAAAQFAEALRERPRAQ